MAELRLALTVAVRMMSPSHAPRKGWRLCAGLSLLLWGMAGGRSQEGVGSVVMMVLVCDIDISRLVGGAMSSSVSAASQNGSSLKR